MLTYKINELAQLFIAWLTGVSEQKLADAVSGAQLTWHTSSEKTFMRTWKGDSKNP